MSFMNMLQTIYSVQNQYIFDLVHKDKLPREMMEAFWHLTQCITVHPLPVTIRQRQYEALSRRFPQVCCGALLLF